MKRIFNRDFLVLSILTLIAVLTWIVYGGYQALTKYTLPEILEQQMRPLNPKIEKLKIKELQKRLRISEEELKEISLPTETIETTQSATPSGGH